MAEKPDERFDDVPCFWFCGPCCCGTAERRFNTVKTVAKTKDIKDLASSRKEIEKRRVSETGHYIIDMKISVDTWKTKVKRFFRNLNHRFQVNHSVGGHLKKDYDERENSRRVKQILVRSDVRAGNALEDHYEYVCHLGTGKYGSVERWRTRDGRGHSGDVAVKKIKWSNVSSNRHLSMRCLVKCFDKDAIKNVENELRMFLELDNPFIVKGREWFEHSWKGIFFVMEFLDGETLQDFLDRLADGQIDSPRCFPTEIPLPEQMSEETEWQTLRRMFNHMCYAVSYMHSKNIIHRDMKPDNVMLVKDQCYRCVKLIDFGLSEVCHEDAMGLKTKGPVIVGTLTFMSPELLQLGAMQTKACDMWAMGVILIWMVSSVARKQLIHPFSPNDVVLDGFISPGGTDFFYLMESFETEPYWNKSLFSDVGLDDAFYEVADGLLEKDPARRMEAEQLLMSNFVHAAVIRHETRMKSQLTGTGGILNSIRSYAGLSKFDQAILSVMAEHISPLQVMNIQRIFRKMDTDQNGKLSRDELLNAFELAGAKLSIEDEDAIDVLFEGGKKDLDYSDWVATEIANSILSDETTTQHAFWSLDTSGTGSLTLDDLVVVVGERDARTIFEDLRKEEEGAINFEEFQGIVGEMARKRASVITSSGRKTSIADMRRRTSDSNADLRESTNTQVSDLRRSSIVTVFADAGLGSQVSDTSPPNSSGSEAAKKAAKIMNIIASYDNMGDESVSKEAEQLHRTMPVLSKSRTSQFGPEDADDIDDLDDAESFMQRRRKFLRRASTTNPPTKAGKKHFASWAGNLLESVIPAKADEGIRATTGFAKPKLHRRQTCGLEATSSTSFGNQSANTGLTSQTVENSYTWERPDISACLILQDR